MTRWEKIERIRKRYYGKYARKAKRALHNQVKPIFEYLENYSVEGLEYNIDSLIKADELKELYFALYEEVGLKFRQVTTNQFKRKDLQDDLWTQEMREYVETFAFQNIQWATETTKDITVSTLQKIMARQVDEGLSVTAVKREIIKSLRSEYGKIEDWRALRIAHTEVMTASNTATAMSEGDILIPVRKVWITAPFGVARTQERHTLMGLEDQKPMKGMPFFVGGAYMQHPGDPAGGPENVINCRCSLAYEPIELN